MAGRDQQDAKSWQAGHHSDGELYHRVSLVCASVSPSWIIAYFLTFVLQFLDIQLVDSSLFFRATRRCVEVRRSQPHPAHDHRRTDLLIRFPLAFQIFFTGCIWVMCPFLPDSPRLLIRKGKYEDALDVIAALEGHGATRDSQSVKTQFAIIKDVLDREHLNSFTWMQLVTGRGPSGVLRRMILGAWMQAMNQVSGINGE